MSIQSLMPSNHFILCLPLLLLPSIFPSIRVFFSSESVLCIRWPKYWSFTFSISPSNEYSELISFRIDWFLLLAVQVTQESSPTLQFENNQFFGAQSYFWSNINICIWLLEKPQLWLDRLAGKLMSLFFNMLSIFVIAFLPRSKYLLISCCSHCRK